MSKFHTSIKKFNYSMKKGGQMVSHPFNGEASAKCIYCEKAFRKTHFSLKKGIELILPDSC